MQLLHSANESAASPESCACGLLGGIHVIMQFIRREMRRHRSELSLPHFRSLLFVCHEPDATVSTLAEHVGLSLPAASRLVDALVRRGLLKRQSHRHDRRRVSLSLTKRGHSVLDTAKAATEKALARQFKSVPQRKLANILAAMKLLNHVFTQKNGRDGSAAQPRTTTDSARGGYR